jgi:hypothetical protein
MEFVMRSVPTVIIAGSALLCSATLTIAQESKAPGAPGAGQGSPPAAAHPSGPPSGSKGPAGAPNERAAPPSRGPNTENNQSRAKGPANKDAGRSAEGKDRPAGRPDRKAAEENQQRKGAAERKQEKSSRDAKGNEQRPDNPKNAERKGGEKQAKGREDVRAAREKLSSDQGQHLRTGFDLKRAHVDHAKFAVQRGTRIPRDIRLFLIPAAVIGLVPAYSYYRYVVVDDRVCIIDPDSYEIVDVIDEGPNPATASRPGQPQRATLQLSSPERSVVRDSIASDFPQADVRVRLALGAEVPRSVELHDFPVVVLDRVPQLRDFRFVVVERDIVVVDPHDRGVAMVIER